MSWYLIRMPKHQWDTIMLLGESRLKGGSFKTLLCRLSLWYAVYHIWQQSNV